MAIALAAGAMDVHMQRHPSLTHPHPRARPPPDDGALSIGVFSVDELLWTCRPTDPTTLQHQKGCRLFEQQERMFFARPGREIIRAGYRPEDVVEDRQKPSMAQMQGEQAGLAQVQQLREQLQLQAQAQSLPPPQVQVPSQAQTQIQLQAQVQGQAQLATPPAPLTTHHFVLEHDRERERTRPGARRSSKRGGGGGSGAATPTSAGRRRRRASTLTAGEPADFEMYAEAAAGGGALGDESDALGMLVDGHGHGHGHDPRQRERNDALLVQQVQQQIQLASGEHPAQVSLAMSMSMAMPIPRTRQPAASRRSSGASSRAMSPRTEDRRGRAEAGVVLGEPSPFVPSR